MKYFLLLFFVALMLMVNGQSIKIESTGKKKQTKSESQKSIKYSYNTIKSINNSWGYDILKDDKIFIHQTNIPGLSGNEGFKTKSDAEKVARIVIKKLKNGEMPPTVTKEELNKLKVL